MHNCTTYILSTWRILIHGVLVVFILPLSNSVGENVIVCIGRVGRMMPEGPKMRPTKDSTIPIRMVHLTSLVAQYSVNSNLKP
jgi:hypothetical protein